MMKKILAGAACAAVLVMGTSAANAGLITKWTVDVASDFNGAETSISGGTIETVGGGLLSWSAGTNPAESSLVQHLFGADGSPGTATTALSVDVDTDGASEAGLSYTHNNIVIGGTPTLSIVIDDSITLTPLVPVGPAFPAVDFDFNIEFVETLNQTPCVVDDGGDPCSDIFVLTDPEGLSFTTPNIMGFKYTVTLDVIGLLALSDAECAAAGVGSGCVGFTTMEGGSTTINTLITITSMEVPAPAALGLLGLGLIGLGAARRRRS